MTNISKRIIDSLNEEDIEELNENEILLEMAYKLSKILNTIDKQAQGKCLTHLILCFVYGSKNKKQSVHHWASEICAFMPRCWKDEKTNKFPPKDTLMKNCYYTWADCWTPSILQDLENKYGPTPEYDIEKVKQAIYEYYDWAFDIFSTKGSLISNEVIEKVQDIVSKL